MDIHVSIAAEDLFSIGPLSVTNSMLTMLIVMAFILIVTIGIARRLQPVPGRKQAFGEIIVEYLLNLVESVGGKKLGRMVFPIVASLFIFIIFANYSGLLPGVGTIGYYESEEVEGDIVVDQGSTNLYTIASVGNEATLQSSQQEDSDNAEVHEEEVLVPFLRAPNADLNMTLALALVAFTSIQVMGIKMNGVKGRLKHMADPAFLFPIEIIAELSRIISLSARLFGNVFAGEMLLTVMYSIAAKTVILFALPVIFLLLETLFGAVQALVFALLTMIYIMLAAGHGDSHEHEEHSEEAHEDAASAVAAAVSAGD